MILAPAGEFRPWVSAWGGRGWVALAGRFPHRLRLGLPGAAPEALERSGDPHAPGRLSGRLLALGAALLWSTSGLFAKAPVFETSWPESVRGPLLAFWRAAFAALVLLPLVRRPRWSVLLVPMAVCFSLMSLTYMTAMARTTAANAIWLQATAPWWVFLLSVTLLREPVARRDLVPLGFGFLGVGLILLFELGIHTQERVGVVCGLGAGVTYACVIMFTRRLRDHSAIWLVAFNHVVATAVLLPWAIRIGVRPSPTQLAVLACFGALQMGVPYVLLSRALRTISSQEAIAICLVEPVLTPLWTYLAWGEMPAQWTIVGAGLILAGLVLRYVILELFRPTGRTGRADRRT